MNQQPTTIDDLRQADIDTTGMSADEIEGLSRCFDDIEHGFPQLYAEQAD